MPSQESYATLLKGYCSEEEREDIVVQANQLAELLVNFYLEGRGYGQK